MENIIPTQTTVSDLCDALGRKEIAARLEVGAAAVSNASSDGLFPAGWYAVIREMCQESGLNCPDTLFNFRPANSRRSPDPRQSSVGGGV